MHSKLLCTAALFAVIAQAHAEHYTFMPVPLGAGFTAPALNNAGTIAHGVGVSPSQSFELLPRGGTPSTLLDTSGIFASFTAPHPIPLNNNETIAFRGTLDTGVEGIYTFGPSGLTTIADTTGPFSGFGPPPSLPALNDRGQVSFTAELRGGGSGVFLGDGATTTTLATTAAGAFSGFGGLSVGLNNQSDTVVLSTLTGDGQALLLSRGGGPALPILDTSGPISAFGTFANINDSGAVAFVANLDAGGQSAFLWDRGTLTPLMSTGGGITALGNMSINGQGTVSILANESGANYAIYLYTPGSGLNRLIGAGDSLLGSTVSVPGRGIFTSVNSLNDLDELAFNTVLNDGRFVTALASPIPEPSTYGLLAFGFAAMGFLQGKKRMRSQAV